MKNKKSTQNNSPKSSYNNLLNMSFSNINNISSKNPLNNISDDNYKIPISINKNIKSAFIIVLNKIGIDILNPKDFIQAIYNFILKETNSPQIEDYENRIEGFVKTFIFFLVNWKFSSLEQTFGVEENIIKILLKKQLFKCNYLRLHNIESYKSNDNLKEKNYFIIYNIIKSIEYKYSVNIVGIANYKENENEAIYSCVLKFNWFIKFIDYIIIYYLSNNKIIPFSKFINNLDMKKEIEKFDKAERFDLSYFFSLEEKETFNKNIIYIVENIIYNLINKN